LRHRGQEVDLFDPFGRAITWTPEFHVGLLHIGFRRFSDASHKFLDDLTGFRNFYHYVQHFYIDGQPRHIVSPDRSFIAILSLAEYREMSVQTVQNILRDKHILITGMPVQSISFDSKGLQTLTNLDARIDIQGESVFVI
jgi:hypothetical protein